MVQRESKRERDEIQRGGKWRNERARRGLAWVAEGVGRRREGAGLRVNGGDETDEVAVGVMELVRDQRSSGARAREAGRSSGWSRYLATRAPGRGTRLQERPGGAARGGGHGHG